MKDMFFNYDNNINTDIPYNVEPAELKKLESNPNLALVKDLKGNDIGICARYGTSFDLYFTLSGLVEGSSIEELILKSNVSFKLLDYWHEKVLEIVQLAEQAYIGNNCLKITITEEQAKQLRQETYYMQLSLIWDTGSYLLYNTDNGFLTIK